MDFVVTGHDSTSRRKYVGAIGSLALADPDRDRPDMQPYAQHLGQRRELAEHGRLGFGPYALEQPLARQFDQNGIFRGLNIVCTASRRGTDQSARKRHVRRNLTPCAKLHQGSTKSPVLRHSGLRSHPGRADFVH